MEIVVCYFDGGCEPKNPGGHGTYGAIVKDTKENILYSASGYLGFGPSMSNNVAEYAGVIAVMEFLVEGELKEGTIYGDSKLVIKQMSGHWGAKGGLYIENYKRAISLRKQLPLIRFQWIPRWKNSEADALGRQAFPVGQSFRRKRSIAELRREQMCDDHDRILRFQLGEFWSTK